MDWHTLTDFRKDIPELTWDSKASNWHSVWLEIMLGNARVPAQFFADCTHSWCQTEQGIVSFHHVKKWRYYDETV